MVSDFLEIISINAKGNYIFGLEVKMQINPKSVNLLATKLTKQSLISVQTLLYSIETKQMFRL